VALRRPRACGGLPPTAPSGRPRASARGRNPGGVRGKLSPAQFGVIRRSLNATWYKNLGSQPEKMISSAKKAIGKKIPAKPGVFIAIGENNCF